MAKSLAKRLQAERARVMIEKEELRRTDDAFAKLNRWMENIIAAQEESHARQIKALEDAVEDLQEYRDSLAALARRIENVFATFVDQKLEKPDDVIEVWELTDQPPGDID